MKKINLDFIFQHFLCGLKFPGTQKKLSRDVNFNGKILLKHKVITRIILINSIKILYFYFKAFLFVYSLKIC
jgi:hypothetical protein